MSLLRDLEKFYYVDFELLHILVSQCSWHIIIEPFSKELCQCVIKNGNCVLKTSIPVIFYSSFLITGVCN